MQTLVVGYGNTLRRDDGLGIRAAEALLSSPLPPGVTVLTCQQLLPELAATLAKFDQVIFMDASAPGFLSRRAGAIQSLFVHPHDTQPAGITHFFGPTALLALAHTLYGRAPAARLFTMQADNFDLSEELSPVVAAALPDLLAQVRACFAE